MDGNMLKKRNYKYQIIVFGILDGIKRIQAKQEVIMKIICNFYFLCVR
jgi:hypothetical protein